ncbi:MAG TPA: nuclear transport factor 2 family protein [Jatrophihabitantaceae bacterium]|nr:nuclear transport factor 2 family protein [Jatrophihabitantaceae bacterium]
MPSVAEMRATVDKYLELVASGTAEQLADLYADDATVEDPVGTDPHVGRDGVLEFYKVIEPFKRSTELVSFKAAGNVAVFEFHIVTYFDAMTIELNPVDVMEFGDDGLVTRMRALWGPEDMVRRDA